MIGAMVQKPKNKSRERRGGRLRFCTKHIVDERTKRGKKEYLVMWKGFGVNDSTWEPEDSLASAKTALDEYVRMNSSRLGSSRRSTRK